MLHKLKSLTFQTPTTESEAIMSIANGLTYFFIHHCRKTVIAILVIAGCILYLAIDYFRSEKVGIEKLLPMKPTTELFNWNIVPQAIAGQQGDSLKVNGLMYGFYDPNFQIWKVQGEPAIYVHDKRNFSVYKVTVPSIQGIRK